MTISKTVCPVTKKEMPIDIDMSGPRSALPAGSEILGYTFTLSKCPECGGTHAWESSNTDHVRRTATSVWTATTPSKQQRQHASRHS